MAAETPIERPVPRPDTPPLRIQLGGSAPDAGVYAVGTPEFRYWSAADALRRGAEFWTQLMPAGTGWQLGAALPVELDLGADLNAYYSRDADPNGRIARGLSFYHATVGGRTIYSGESPDVCCHELGHAVLDALRPELWDAASTEADAFHESFGDMSAILSAIQLPSIRQEVLAETGGRLYRSSRLSRVAEQLGWGIRQGRPDAVDPDCLRNAVNSFFYQDPVTLPPVAPASMLSSAAHSFSRVFTGAFFEVLAGMLTAQAAAPTEADLLQVGGEAGRLLVDAISEAPVVPDYFSHVAAHMIEADDTRFDRKYREALKSGFVRHGVLSLEAVSAMTRSVVAAAPRRVGAGMTDRGYTPAAGAALPLVPIPCGEYGFGVTALLVHASAEPRRFGVASAAPDFGSVAAANPSRAAKSYLEDLLRRGRLDLGAHGDLDARVTHPTVRKTHELVAQDGGLVLVRRSFDCGFE